MTETSTLVTTTTRSSQRPQPAPEGPRRSTRRRWPERRADESGLTTLEWLLIVAAVAGLAALAVVLVQNVVSDTSEQIAGSSARRTAATIAADQLMNDAVDTKQPTGISNFGEWANFWSNRCTRLNITYGDADITAVPNFNFLADVNAASAFVPATVVKGTVQKTGATVDVPDLTPPGANAAIAECRIV